MNITLDPMLAYKALQRVARDEIVSEDTLLRHRHDVLPPQVLSILGSLRDLGYIEKVTDGDGVVSLTIVGTQLLDMCHRQPSAIANLFGRTDDASSGELAVAAASEVIRDDVRS